MVDFEGLKRLTGVWRQAGQPDSPLRIHFALTAAGTVLTERWLRGQREHSLTVYHRDGGAIVATHYCPQGNQPRLTSTARSGDQVIRFVFRDATDLDAPREAYLTELSFDLTDESTIMRRESYRKGNTEEPSELRMVRDTPADTR